MSEITWTGQTSFHSLLMELINSTQASALTLILKMMPCFPWTPTEPTHKWCLCVCVWPLRGNNRPTFPHQIAGYGPNWESTWPSAAEGVCMERENTLLPLACDSASNKRLICCDMLFLSPVDLWQGCCKEAAAGSAVQTAKCCWWDLLKRSWSRLIIRKLLGLFHLITEGNSLSQERRGGSTCWKTEFVKLSQNWWQDEGSILSEKLEQNLHSST